MLCYYLSPAVEFVLSCERNIVEGETRNSAIKMYPWTCARFTDDVEFNTQLSTQRESDWSTRFSSTSLIGGDSLTSLIRNLR